MSDDFTIQPGDIVIGKEALRVHNETIIAKATAQLQATISQLQGELEAYSNYQPSDIEIENWSFQHFDFLDKDEKVALKLLSNKAKQAALLQAELQHFKDRCACGTDYDLP